MPYAQHHYPFQNEKAFEKEKFPAQFIAEGLDQTRGWFYSMLVLGAALFDKSPYQNVIVNGLVLAEDGKKMSKSLQNYPDPMELAERTGVDAMRFYLLSSPVIKGEDLNFSEKEVKEIERKNIGRLHNVLTMYQMFADGTPARNDSDHVLDRWIVVRLNQLIAEATAGYKSYELDRATRPITDFIDDVSVWYLRRSRDRLKGTDEADANAALATLRHVLRTLALIMAPVMPFYAEYLWQAVREKNDPESVHIGSWPSAGPIQEELLKNMSSTRSVVTAALEARTKAGIKVRQPLASLLTNKLLTPEFTNIIAEEVNVKLVSTEGSDIAVLDLTITDELHAEGAVRELMRAIQGLRKKEGLEPDDEIELTIATDQSGQAAVVTHQELLTHTVNAKSLTYADTEGEEVATDRFRFVFSIEKA
jgi:isoleucyl-tRNA synthetase